VPLVDDDVGLAAELGQVGGDVRRQREQALAGQVDSAVVLERPDVGADQEHDGQGGLEGAVGGDGVAAAGQRPQPGQRLDQQRRDGQRRA
jgi:hypothetical protein